MIRLLISVALALAVATSVQAMSPAPLHQPNGMITQIRQACDDPNQVLVNGVCEEYARHVSRAQHVCVAWNEGFCIEYYGTLKPCGPEVRC